MMYFQVYAENRFQGDFILPLPPMWQGAMRLWVCYANLSLAHFYSTITDTQNNPLKHSWDSSEYMSTDCLSTMVNSCSKPAKCFLCKIELSDNN